MNRITVRSLKKCSALVLLCFIFVLPLSAQQTRIDLDKLVSAQFPDIEMSQIVVYLGKAAGGNIVAAPEIAAQKINISLSQMPLRQVLDTICQAYSWEWKETPDGTVIIALPKGPEPDKLVEKRFHPKYIRNWEGLQALVQQAMTAGEGRQLTIVPNQSLVIVRDTLEGLARVEDLIRLMDQPTVRRSFELPYANVDEVAQLIQAQFPDLPRAPVIDARTGTIYIEASPQDMQEIQELINLWGKQLSFRKIQLKFADAEQAEFILSTAVDMNILSPEGQAVYDDRTRVIMAMDTEDRLDRLEELVLAMDVSPLAVYIEAEAVRVGDSFNFSAQVKWDNMGIINATASQDFPLTSGAFVKTVVDPTTGKEVIVKDPGRIFGERTDTLLQLADGGLNATYFNAGKLLAQVRLMESNGEAESLSAPRLIVKHNEEANLTVGTEEPFGVRQYMGNTNSAYSDDVVTSRYRRVGINMDVLPQISPGGYIEMDVRVENSSLLERVDVGQGTLAPRIQTNEIVTTLIVKDGRTVVVGGLISRTKDQSRSGVPYLKDIPGVGFIFRNNDEKKEERSKFLAFLTPHIISIDDPYQRYMVDDSDRRQYHQDRGVSEWMDEDQSYLDDYAQRQAEKSGETFGRDKPAGSVVDDVTLETPSGAGVGETPFSLRARDTMLQHAPGLDVIIPEISLQSASIDQFLTVLANTSKLSFSLVEDIHADVTVNQRNATVRQLLDEVLTANNLQWQEEIDGSIYVDRRKWAPSEPAPGEAQTSPGQLTAGAGLDAVASFPGDELSGNLLVVLTELQNRVDGVYFVKDGAVPNDSVTVSTAGKTVRQVLDAICASQGLRWEQNASVIKLFVNDAAVQAQGQVTEATDTQQQPVGQVAPTTGEAPLAESPNAVAEPATAPAIEPQPTDTPVQAPIPPERENLGLNRKVTMGLANQKLSSVLKFLSMQAGSEVTCAPELESIAVSVDAAGVPVRQVLNQLAAEHGWRVVGTPTGGARVEPAVAGQGGLSGTENVPQTEKPADLSGMVGSLSYKGPSSGFFSQLMNYTSVQIMPEPSVNVEMEASYQNRTVNDILTDACQKYGWAMVPQGSRLLIRKK